uniref:Uncharacterized protein n=1 Tax=Phlebotomus papatasi TaxID=29031 RepID=A0A1B0GN83_PHLPP
MFFFSILLSENTNLSFVTGFRGSRKLKIGDYSFTKNKVSGFKTYWSCARAALCKCKARVVTVYENGVQSAIIRCSTHNHRNNKELHWILNEEDRHPVSFVTGQRGSTLLGSSMCRARAVTIRNKDEDVLISRTKYHNHVCAYRKTMGH